MSALSQGRAFCEQRSWEDAHRSLAEADASDASEDLAAEDLERYSTAAYMLQREDEALGILERAHRAYVDEGELLHAARSACLLGLHLAFAGQTGPASPGSR